MIRDDTYKTLSDDMSRLAQKIGVEAKQFRGWGLADQASEDVRRVLDLVGDALSSRLEDNDAGLA